VHLHRSPASGGYGEIRIAHRGQRLALVAFPDVEIEVASLLG
jgi:hypothetical protein